MRNESTGITSVLGARGILVVSDDENYYLVRDAEQAWFDPHGANYVMGTDETTQVDVAGGRTAKVVRISDRTAFNETALTASREREAREHRNEDAQRKYDEARRACDTWIPTSRDEAAKEFTRQLVTWSAVLSRGEIEARPPGSAPGPSASIPSSAEPAPSSAQPRMPRAPQRPAPQMCRGGGFLGLGTIPCSQLPPEERKAARIEQTTQAAP